MLADLQEAVFFGDLLLKIMAKLDINSVKRGACVSRRWRDASAQPIVYDISPSSTPAHVPTWE